MQYDFVLKKSVGKQSTCTLQGFQKLFIFSIHQPETKQDKKSIAVTMKAYLSLSIGNADSKKLQLILHDSTCPRTVLNFTTLLSRTSPSGYLHSTFHRLIPQFMIQGGDFTRNDGTGGKSIYGNTFADENFIHSHDDRGILSMANSGRDTNGSQFFITFKATRHLDGKHTVFGHIDKGDEESMKLLDQLEQVRVKKDMPIVPIRITDGGVHRKVDDGNALKKGVFQRNIEDNNEIGAHGRGQDCNDLEPSELQASPEEYPLSSKIGGSKSRLQERLRKLKLKMNQSRHLNHKEVLKEGERGANSIKYHKEIKRQDKMRKEQDWSQIHAKSLSTLQVQNGKDLMGIRKCMTQSGIDAIQDKAKRAGKAEQNEFSANDYHNPEGQFRNYERSLQSIQPERLDNSKKIKEYFASTAKDVRKEREGAKRLAAELCRRAEKSEKRKQKEMDFEGEDVSFINKRNRHFNEKINRTYDKHSADIKRNLERGTAL